jgi:hypothetical protein
MGEILHYLVQALHSIGGFKFFQFSCLKNSWINLFSFGDMNNVPRWLVKFHLGPTII